MKKRFRALALATAMLLQVNVCSALTYKKADYADQNFPDVIGTECEDAALYLKAFGYISGYPDGTFKPEKDITRAEMVRIMFEFSNEAKAALNKQTEPLNNFKDVPTDHWAKQYIEIAAQVGLVSGYGNGIFKPNNNITHAEALTMIMNVHSLRQAVGTWDDPWPNNYLKYALFHGYIENGSNFETLTLDNAKRGDVAIYISKVRNVKWN